MNEVSISELTVFEAYDVVESANSTIRCPNGCYDPYDGDTKNLRAAARLPHCDECGSEHIIEWADEYPDRDGSLEENSP